MPVGKHLTDNHPGSWWITSSRDEFMTAAKQQQERFLKQRSHVVPDFSNNNRVTNRWTDAARKKAGKR